MTKSVKLYYFKVKTWSSNDIICVVLFLFCSNLTFLSPLSIFKIKKKKKKVLNTFGGD